MTYRPAVLPARRFPLVALLLPVLLPMLSFGCGPAEGPAGEPEATLRGHADQWERIVAAEDGRARSSAQLEVLIEATRSPEAVLRALGVRALGRIERPDHLELIAPLLSDSHASVRAEAASALAQAANVDAAPIALEHLREALATEDDPEALGATLEALGRVPHGEAGESEVTLGLLLPHLEGPPALSLSAIRGVHFLARQPEARAAFDGAPVQAVRRQSARPSGRSGELVTRRIRTIAVATLVEIGGADPVLLGEVLEDPEPFVRREAAAGLASLEDSTALRSLSDQALADASGVVRYDALRVYGSRLAESDGCGPVRQAVHDSNPHVALLAIDVLGTRCEPVREDVALLDSLAGGLPSEGAGGWHRPVHALVALARVAPASGSEMLPRFAAHQNLFVRSYAAEVATILGDTVTLRAFARDPHPNVRTAAVRGVHAIRGESGVDIYLAQLSQDDSQLLQAAAEALEGSSAPGAAEALLGALDRISLGRSETSRDARRALLVRAGELGSRAHAERVRPYLRDFDPEIAGLASDVLYAWTGERSEPAATAPPTLPTPTFDEAAALRDAQVIIEMADGEEIELRLFPFDAPTNAARFARLARDGYFDGLTLHRVVPNFVVQGGSPGANEYAGDAPFTRDELARPNWRGSVGLSTRGRDTGDAQFYFNLVDNVRLDTGYTVFAEVVGGMEVVDRLQEGAVIRSVRLR